jgi:hypothetical protein
MTQEQNQTTKKQQNCYCHQNAAEQHEQAAKCHESGDSKAVAHHAHVAQGYLVQANVHKAECCKQYSTTHSCCENN